MSEGKNQAMVTRREFYSTIGTLYVSIGLVGLAAARALQDTGSTWMAAMIISVTAIGCSFLYSFKALRSKNGSRNERGELRT